MGSTSTNNGNKQHSKSELKHEFDRLSREISYLVNTSIASVKVKKLLVEERYRVEPFSMRPVMHVVLSAPIGEMKSTTLAEIADVVKAPVVTELTQPGLIGTIDKQTYQIIPGAAWKVRNKMLLIDEFNLGKEREGWNVFLQLLEDQMWNKRFGGNVISATPEIDGDLYLKAEKGELDIKTRFASIFTTMKSIEYYGSQGFRAFISRTVPYNYRLSRNQIQTILHGKKLFKYEEINPPTEVTIPLKTYTKIIKIVDEEISLEKSDVGNEYYARTVGDCCRFFAVRGTLKGVEKIAQLKIMAHHLIGTATKEGRYNMDNVNADQDHSEEIKENMRRQFEEKKHKKKRDERDERQSNLSDGQ
jgi:hypothetical protein